MSDIPKVLIVDDDPRMCDSLKVLLSDQGYVMKTCNSGQEAIECMSRNAFDLVLLDMVIPDMDGFQIMDCIKRQSPDTLVIVITGHASMEAAIGSLRRRVYDFVRKPFEPEELLRTVENGLDHKRLKSENEVLNEKLAISEERYRDLVQNSPDIIYTLDEQGNFTFISQALERLLSFKIEQLVGKHYTTIIYEEDLKKAEWFFNERRTGDRAAAGIKLRLKVYSDSARFMHCEVRHVTIELKSNGMYNKPAKENDKKFFGTYGVARDISDRKRLEAQLQQAQRMEALGTLAGGISHDFNNLLMGIQGRTSLMLMDKDSSHPDFEHLKGIGDYVKSAVDLTRQLLGFAMGGKYEVKPTDLNNMIKKTSQMFGRTKKEIKIHRRYQEEIWTVEADQGQIEQVLLNLYVNAWQAMSGGGELYIETENVTLNEEYVKPFDVELGKYVKISITDTGIGMDEATQQRIFDPFFTTKEMGRGTGLGLASVYGIIKNHGGFIDVHSEKGEGTTFNIYLPSSESEVKGQKSEISEDVRHGDETVLLVDDEDMIIDVGEQLLEKIGYTVLIARSGKKAMDIYTKYEGKIDIVILDMIMPDLSGSETYDRFKEINPGIKVLLSSGYSIDGQATEILKRGCDGFIQKPFTMEQLSRSIRKVLDKK